MATSEAKNQFFLQNESIRITNQIESRIGMLCLAEHRHIVNMLTSNITFGRLTTNPGTHSFVDFHTTQVDVWQQQEIF